MAVYRSVFNKEANRYLRELRDSSKDTIRKVTGFSNRAGLKRFFELARCSLSDKRPHIGGAASAKMLGGPISIARRWKPSISKAAIIKATSLFFWSRL